LVTLLLADRKPELIKLMPDNFDGGVAFVIGKNLPIYSFGDSGWRMERRYEL